MASEIVTKGRPMGNSEQNWCRAVTSGTGVTVLVLQFSKLPNITLLKNVLLKLQNMHPILLSKLLYNPSTNSFSFVTIPNNHPQVDMFNLSGERNSDSSLPAILEHEINKNVWQNPESYSELGEKMFYVSLYVLKNEKYVVALRLHPVLCDRITAVGLVRELGELMVKGEGDGTEKEIEKERGVSLAIEDLIPKKKTKKTFWAHGKDTFSYSLNSLKLTNMSFIDVKGKRSSQVVRWQMNSHDTTQILHGCKSKGVKLCSILSASALLAANSIKYRPGSQKHKYGVLTLVDCRSLLSPPLSAQNFGFYHAAIFNIIVVEGEETVWDLATNTFKAFEHSKNCNKQFSDMADLNFLMRKAIDNPSLTTSSSLRSSLITVFEDTVIENSGTQPTKSIIHIPQLIAKAQKFHHCTQIHGSLRLFGLPVWDHRFVIAGTKREMVELGLVESMGCSSIHGIGPSIAILDSIQDGRLDCLCVYPSPLHSREQMQEMVNEMKKILIQGSKCSS